MFIFRKITPFSDVQTSRPLFVTVDKMENGNKDKMETNLTTEESSSKPNSLPFVPMKIDIEEKLKSLECLQDVDSVPISNTHVLCYSFEL